MINYNISIHEDGTIDDKLTDREAAEWFKERYTRLPHYEDGTPVKIGDAVKDGETGREVSVDAIKLVCNKLVCGKRWKTWSLIDHRDVYKAVVSDSDGIFERYVEPDSLERIREDALKMLRNYWQCEDYNCADCPAKIDGESPLKRYKVNNCVDAKKLDIIERVRKLYEKDAE